MKTKVRIGVDEAGRGPWCGPVVAVALAWNSNHLPSSEFIDLMNDSKKLSAKKREELYALLIEASQKNILFFWLGVVDNFYIDTHNIRQANKEAMRRALVELLRKLPKELDDISVVIDGKDNYVFDELSQKPLYIIGWDAKVPEIGAASIIAKVFRDKLMSQYATLYPNFWFWENAGYGTKKHQDQLQSKEDVTGIHRLSYKPVKMVLEKKEKVLVHICCGPDATVPLMDLKQEYEVIAYWYDPNIQPVAEYEKRYEAFVEVCNIEGVKYIKGDYDVKNFFKKIKGLEDTPERGEKCTHCYDMRLERTAKLAREMGISKWTSSLNNSPHKDMEKMFHLGEKWDNSPYSALTPTLSQEEREQAAETLGESVEEYMEKVLELSSLQVSLMEGDVAWAKEGAVIEWGSILQEKLDFLKIAFRKNGGFQRSVDYTLKHDIYRQNYCGCVYSDTFPGREKKDAKGGFSG